MFLNIPSNIGGPINSQMIGSRAQQRELVAQAGALLWLENGLVGSVGLDVGDYLACSFQVERWA